MNWRKIFAAASPVAPVHAGQAGEVTAAMAFLVALGCQNFDSVGSFLDDDAVLELPFAGKGLTVKGRKEVLHFFQKTMARSVAAIEYKLEHAYRSHEAGAVVLEISTQGRTAAGLEYTNRLVAVFEFQHGKIVLFREYFNPAPLGG